MMRFVAIGIGCLECSIESDVLCGFDTRALADEWAQQNGLYPSTYDGAAPTCLWSDGGRQYRIEVHEIPAKVIA